MKIACWILAILLLSACAETLVVVGAATTTSLYNDRRTNGTIVEDQSIEFKIRQKLDEAKLSSPGHHIEAVSFNGQVLLAGQVPNDAAKEQAETLAKSVVKVRQVFNHLIVSDTTASFGEKLRDSFITAQVKTRIFASTGLKSAAFKVLTESETVYLLGLVTQQEAKKVVYLVRTTRGVGKVVPILEYTQVP